MDKLTLDKLHHSFCPSIFNIDDYVKMTPYKLHTKQFFKNPYFNYGNFYTHYKKLLSGVITDEMIEMSRDWSKCIDLYIERMNEMQDSIDIGHLKILVMSMGHNPMFNLENPRTVSVLRGNLINKLENNIVLESTQVDLLEKYSLFDKHGNITMTLNDDGDLVLTKKDMDFNKEFDTLHRELKIYRENENIDSIKDVLYQLKFMLVLLNSVIYNKDVDKKSDEYKEAVKLKSFIQKDFNEYLEYVVIKDPKYNFNKEYSKSKYSDDNIIINGRLISAIKELIVKIVMRK